MMAMGNLVHAFDSVYLNQYGRYGSTFNLAKVCSFALTGEAAGYGGRSATGSIMCCPCDFLVLHMHACVILVFRHFSAMMKHRNKANTGKYLV